MILKNNLEICEAKMSDVQSLIPLLEELFLIEKDFTFNKTNHENGLELLINEPKSIIFIAKFEDETIAMASVQTIISTVTGSKTGLIEDFIVKDDFRDMGVGSHIFKYIKNFAKENNIKRLQLVCDNKNLNAKEFYTNKSFKKSNLTAWYNYL